MALYIEDLFPDLAKRYSRTTGVIAREQQLVAAIAVKQSPAAAGLFRLWSDALLTVLADKPGWQRVAVQPCGQSYQDLPGGSMPLEVCWSSCALELLERCVCLFLS